MWLAGASALPRLLRQIPIEEEEETETGMECTCGKGISASQQAGALHISICALGVWPACTDSNRSSTSQRSTIASMIHGYCTHIMLRLLLQRQRQK